MTDRSASGRSPNSTPITATDERAALMVLATVNRAHGTQYSLVGRLPGGYQNGAYELISPDGDRAVLKWFPVPRPLDVVSQAAAAVGAARANGWPTPAWLHWGIGPDGLPYEIQEFVDGWHLDRLDPDSLRLLLDVNARQARLRPPTRHEWSPWIEDMVYRDREAVLDRAALLGREGRQLTSVIVELRRFASNVTLARHDLVCGVFSLENILFGDAGVAGIIDVEAIGRGTRAFDLAVLYSRLSDDEQQSDLGEALRTAACDVDGAGAFAVCLAAEFLGLILFLSNRRSEGVRSMVGLAARSLERLIS
ncbi:MAG TPA: phosphotransferase [Acidimicrobiales bacterium]|nr:phosphotransferase [Acidimicrobiales bacterium]